MKYTNKLIPVLTLLLAVAADKGSAQTITGDPATDAGWTSDGLSTSSGNIMLNAANSANFSVNVYSTAFALASGSTLLGSLGTSDGWNAGDTIVGVGGVFTSMGNSSLTYDNANGTANLHLVVKYGSPTASWTLSGAGKTVNGAGSLNYGGTGSVLLGVLQETVSSTTGLTTPSDSPLYLNSVGSQVTLPGAGNEGQVLTFWNGSTLEGFESFMDLTLLNSEEPNADVALGDDFVLDLQQGSGAYQDSLGTLPSTATSVTPVPEPSTVIAGAMLLVPFGVSTFRKLRNRKA